ncbi:dephospho-CoA kinase [Massilia sp. W12]|uniref:dephospho-CoA kinase n=1 Tax=Massilia sp. W12 TaxID=3126507 RepID=UPI0030CDEF0E
MAPRFTVGVSGGIGSGKSSVTRLFEELGVPVIDTDILAHQLTAPGGAAMPAIVAAFGPQFMQADGALDRARMRAQAFAQTDAREKLQQILHPLIQQAAQTCAEAASGPYLMFAIPLLVESGHWRQKLHRVLVVDCSEAQQIERVMARNAFSREQVLAIMAAQASRQARLAAADDVIDNSAGPENLPSQVALLHQRYLELAKTI